MGAVIARALRLVTGLAGFLAVAFGAFGAHALENALSPEQIDWWETATFYLLIHAGLGAALSLQSEHSRLNLAGLIMVSGAILFAATLYIMALGGPRWLGAITPIGGLGMLSGWGLIILSAARSP